MMKQVFLCLLALTAQPSWAEAQSRSDTFRALLALVPVSFLGPITARWDIDFSDLQAAAIAISAPPEGTNDLFQTALGPLFRAGIAPLSDAITDAVLTAWPERVGFGPGQVTAAISVMGAPDTALLLQLDPGGAAGAAPVLRANGYGETDQMGYPALFRGDEDGSFDIAARDDPFGAGMGMSSRIGFAGDILMQTRGWPMLTSLMAPSEPKLSDHPEIAALLAALDAAPAELGGLVRVRLLSDPVSMAAWNPLVGLPVGPLADVLTGQTPKTRLPFWSMGLLADLASPDTETAVIALVFPTRTAADTATAILQSAWQFQLSPASGRSFQDITGARAGTSVSGAGPFVALLIATLPTSAHRGMIENSIWLVLLQAYHQRDLLLLAPAMP